jgi:hypothetical protein
MATKTEGLRAKVAGAKKLTKVRVGKAKYPIVKLLRGESVTLPIASPADERRMRKSADNFNLRHEGFIRARKKGDHITFTRIR